MRQRLFALCFVLEIEIGRHAPIWTENFGFGDRRFADWNYAPVNLFTLHELNTWPPACEACSRILNSFQLQSCWSFGVSDGNRTRNPRFGRPTLSRFELRSQNLKYKKVWCIGKDLNFHSESATVLQTACLTGGDRCVKNKFFCVKMKKAEI